MALRKIIIAAAIIAVVVLTNQSQAEQKITQQDIANINQELETAFNALQHTQAVTTLHNTIDNDARITMQVENPTLPAANRQQVLQIDKAQYINSFLQALPHITDYKTDISTHSFDYDPQTGTAYTTDVMTETGRMLNDMIIGESSGAKSFTSETICKTAYKNESGQIQATQKNCKVRVSLDEFI